MLTIGYVRVSTDDQVEHSPAAQRKRCAEYARSKGLEPPQFLCDEGLSGKNLHRPAMQQLIELIEADQVANLIVWRIDRLSRDSGDVNRLLKLFEKHCVIVHSLSEGTVESVTASGRFTAGMHGLLAQLEREKIIENVTTSMHELTRAGYWLNTTPIGYRLEDRILYPDDDAHLVRRAFKIRADGASLPQVANATGLKYSRVRHLLQNRVYLGEVCIRDEWFPGRHEALVTPEQFDAAHRGHIPGRRRGNDLLTGRVRCGLCGRLTAIDTNGRNKPIYRCRHRGQGCRIPGRSAAGLHRAARLGIELLRTDDQLIEAIRFQLAGKAERAGSGAAEPTRSGALASLTRKRDRLLQLYLDDKITDDYFAAQERSITDKINALQADHTEAIETAKTTNVLAQAFERAAALLRDPDFEFETIWDNANDKERRVLVEELIEAVTIHADRLEVTVTGAPPFLVKLDEVGLRPSGTGPVVSEDRRERSQPTPDWGGGSIAQRDCVAPPVKPSTSTVGWHCSVGGRSTYRASY